MYAREVAMPIINPDVIRFPVPVSNDSIEVAICVKIA
jgi:hypothetical protein